MIFCRAMTRTHRNHILRFVFFCIVLISPVQWSFSQLKLPRLVSDGMVLQRDTEVRIWGWASEYELITVRFLNSTYTTHANSSGEWEVFIEPLPAGGPYTMVIEAGEEITISDILIGDVWVCSGQSNMELPIRRVRPLYESEIANSTNPFIRHFTVPQKYDFKKPHVDLESGQWVSSNPETVLDFSAVAYFFAKELYEIYHVPIGLIHASLGGSPVEAWISEDALKEFPGYYHEALRFRDDNLIRQIESDDRKRIEAWYNLLYQRDRGYATSAAQWINPDLDTSDWFVMDIPGFWADTDIGPVNGVVWFRKEFDVPAHLANKTVRLNLGKIIDSDSVYLNGIFIGATAYRYPPRWYEIPAGVLREGINTLVVRVINTSGRGGFVRDKPYEIVAGDTVIDLKGEWKFQLGAEMEPLASQTFIRWKPLGLYNAMIHPLRKYTIKGVIWYQGESNTNRPLEYRELFPAMIRDWRRNWGQGDFPFLYVQLANYMEATLQPAESNWALLRESQLKTLSVPNTAMAVAYDIGEWNDIHPLNKKDVGIRLARAAQRVAYGDADVVHSGPIYESMKVEGNQIIVTFTSTGSGLIAKGGGALRHFAIAGEDRKFVWANARIENSHVVVWSDEVEHPAAVRYAWADNPEGANLYNVEGLPASPFRTDEW